MSRPLHSWLRALRLVWQAAPGWSSLWAGLLFLLGLLPLAQTLLLARLVDQLARLPDQPPQTAQLALTLGLGLGSLLLGELLAAVQEYARTAQGELVQDRLKTLIQQQSARIDLAFYEQPEFYDRLDRARQEASNRATSLLEQSGSLIQHSITLLVMAAALLSFEWWIPLLLVVGTLPAFLALVRDNRHFHRWWQATTAERRWLYYYDALLTQNEAAAEVRLFNLGGHFQQAHQTLRTQLRFQRLALLRSQLLTRAGAISLGLLSAGGALGWMLWRTLAGQLSLGELAFFAQAFSRGQDLLRSLLSSAGQIYGAGLFLHDLFAFLDLQPQIVDPPQPTTPPERLHHGIDFAGVHFRYPGSQHLALQDCHLHIPAGTISAIVGMNGAGKSTLLKLLCRFYDPQQGQVSLDGIDLRDLALADLRRRISVLFQAPMPYHAPAAENIGLGDLERAGDAAAIEAAAHAAGAHDFINKLPGGYQTLLGRWFADGAELSGGEWQRLATARAFLRDAPILLLDEPTSAMDPWAEADWFARLRELARGRTTLVITHRLTIARHADLIHVMERGRVVETGKHDQLLALGGLYAQSWTAQDRLNQQTQSIL